MEQSLYKRQIAEYLDEYHTNNQWDSLILDDHIDNLIFVRSKMRGRVELSPLPYLSYKRTLLSLIRKDYALDIEVDDETLMSNYLPSGEKLTKKLSKEIAVARESKYYPQESRLDYFNKLRNEKNTYIISSDPFDILDLYNNQEAPNTCISAGGSNQSTMYRYLYSDQIYIAFTSDKRSRLIIYDNPEEKIVSLGRIYGERDHMLPQVVIKYYIGLGYSFAEYPNMFFDMSDWYYIDAPNFEFGAVVREMGGDLFSERNAHLLKTSHTPINRIPAHWDKTYTAFTCEPLQKTIINGAFKDTGEYITDMDAYLCESCGRIVRYDEYNEGSEMCDECDEESMSYGTYCSGCDSWYNYEDLSEDGYCQNCEDEMTKHECSACGKIVSERHFIDETGLCNRCDYEGRKLDEATTGMEDVNMFRLTALGFVRSLANPNYIIWYKGDENYNFKIKEKEVELNGYFTMEELAGIVEYGSTRQHWLKKGRTRFFHFVEESKNRFVDTRTSDHEISYNSKSKIIWLKGEFPFNDLVALYYSLANILNYNTN